MLEDVSISDFALIESVSLDFNGGFTVLSGETGAGKSILIGALSFLLGAKGGTEVIRAGAQEARVSGTFVLSAADTEAAAWLDAHGVEAENDRVLLRRFVRDTGKTGAWIQNTSVTRAELAEFSTFLVDIHGQHEHQSLMRVAEHRRFLDSYAGITAETAAFTELYAQLVEKRRQLDELNSSDSERARKAEMLSFAIAEITDAKLLPNEDEELTAEETRLSRFEQIYSEIEGVGGILSDAGDGAADSVVGALKRARSLMARAAAADANLAPLDSRLESAFYELSDIAEEISAYRQALVFDPARLEAVQERLALLFKLKKKYAASIQSPIGDVAAYAESAQKELDTLTGSEAGKTALAAEVDRLERSAYAAAKSLSDKRRAAADKMAAEVESVLSVLGMKGTAFSVSITGKPSGDTGTGVTQTCGPYGMDNVEFLLSANAGSPLKPLAKIASGGELSRVMLALKTILAESDTVGTLVFDEIDTGIGGEVSVAVGAHLKQLAKKSQIFCITHVASIASYADNQIKIEKGNKNGTTVTCVSAVTGQARVEEIARMLSGDSFSAESLEHARSLLSKFGGDAEWQKSL